MDKAVDEVLHTESDYFWGDLINSGGRRSSAGWMEWWSALTASGVLGTPTLASREKGEQMLAAAARGLADLVLEVKSWPRRSRVDHHADHTGSASKWN
jgi:creatinine amidohydrolase